MTRIFFMLLFAAFVLCAFPMNALASDCGCGCDEEFGECRMTGGHVTVYGEYLEGTVAEVNKNGKVKVKYTCGGQAGAPNDNDPSYGNWTHTHHGGFNFSFTFHAGTSSAPEGTEISQIICGDPGWCSPARPAPFKQIYFDGVGVFKNEKGFAAYVSDEHPGAQVSVGETLHRFEVYVVDAGEPGGNNRQQSSAKCEWAPDLSGATFVPLDVDRGDCEDCPDYYAIRIYSDEVGSEIIYQVNDFITHGNLQIHPEIR